MPMPSATNGIWQPCVLCIADSSMQTVREKVYLLRELEHVAYQEMRRFIMSGSQARFVM